MKIVLHRLNLQTAQFEQETIDTPELTEVEVYSQSGEKIKISTAGDWIVMSASSYLALRTVANGNSILVKGK